MASSDQDSSAPPAGGRPPRKPRSFTPLAAMRAQVHEGAKELVVDDFVDTYFQERPKTLPPISPKGAEPPRPPAEPGASRATQAAEESGVRKALGGQVAAIEVSIPDDEDLVVMEAELADRDDKISTLEDELQRLRGEIGELRSTRGVELALAPPEPEASPAPPALPIASPILAMTPAVPSPPREPIAGPIAGPIPGPAATASRPRSAAQLALGGLLAAAAIAAVAIGVFKRGPAEADPPAMVDDQARAGAPEVPEPQKATPPADEPRAASPPLAPPAPSSAPATSAAAPPASSTAANPSAVPPAAPASTEPAPTLLSFQALLTVASSVDAEVVVQGQSVGRTNQRLLTRCGPRNVRLRQEGAWISPGEHVRIVCMEHTQIRVDPAK